MKKFKVRYYETVYEDNSREYGKDKIIEKKIKAGLFFIDIGILIFQDDGKNVAAFRNFISVEEIENE